MSVIMDSISQSQELVRKDQSGDRHAFNALTSDCREAIDRFVRLPVGSHLRDSVQIEDVLQTTLSRALESIEGEEKVPSEVPDPPS